jgi:prepilin-type N-terminal cleavage/methylation domain-containing protein
MIKKIRNFKFVIRNYQAGMTYVELIVVLSIFSIMTSIVLFNYNGFQAKVDIKVLANDIASKIIEAQKSALAGQLTTGSPVNWQPAYGVYFDTSSPKQFIYFADFNSPINGYNAGEALSTINITKNDSISRIDSYIGTTLNQQITNPLSITFRRPDSSAVFTSSGLSSGFEYIQITIASPLSITSNIKIYPSGRIQIN